MHVRVKQHGGDLAAGVAVKPVAAEVGSSPAGRLAQQGWQAGDSSAGASGSSVGGSTRQHPAVCGAVWHSVTVCGSPEPKSRVVLHRVICTGSFSLGLLSAIHCARAVSHAGARPSSLTFVLFSQPLGAQTHLRGVFL